MHVIAALALGLLLSSGALHGQEPALKLELHPLEAADTSSPRATLKSFVHGMTKTSELYAAADPAYRAYFVDARRCLNVSEVPPHVLESTTVDTALLLKEVLDRIELPAFAEVPGSEEVMDDGLTRWTIPHTEIDLVLVRDGRREGDFLFSPETVARSREYFERVRDLPYRPGKLGAHYDELRFAAQSRFLAGLISELPPWAREEYKGQLAWQWAILFLLVLFSIALVAGSIALGRRLSGSTNRFGGGRRFGAPRCTARRLK